MGEPTRHEELWGTHVPPAMGGGTRVSAQVGDKKASKTPKKPLKMAILGSHRSLRTVGAKKGYFWGFLAVFLPLDPKICQNLGVRRDYEKRPQTQRSEPLRERKSIIGRLQEAALPDAESEKTFAPGGEI